MHKGFTPAQYRGQRLHGLGMAGALQALTAQGYQGLGFRRGGEQC